MHAWPPFPKLRQFMTLNFHVHVLSKFVAVRLWDRCSIHLYTYSQLDHFGTMCTCVNTVQMYRNGSSVEHVQPTANGVSRSHADIHMFIAIIFHCVHTNSHTNELQKYTIQLWI